MRFVLFIVGGFFFFYGLYLAFGGSGAQYLSGLGGGILALIGAVFIVGACVMDGIDDVVRQQKESTDKIISALKKPD